MDHNLVTVRDPELLALLEKESETVEQKHPNGRTIGFLKMDWPGRYPFPFTVPFPKEFLQRSHSECGSDDEVSGKTLPEIIRELESRYGTDDCAIIVHEKTSEVAVAAHET